jgi:hypothetical protein
MEKHIESDYISEYKPCLYDGSCGEVIAWGYEFKVNTPSDEFNRLLVFGEKACVYPTWFLITKKLTRKEAIQKYGDITDEQFGPRGGFRNTTYGNTKFLTKLK